MINETTLTTTLNDYATVASLSDYVKTNKDGSININSTKAGYNDGGVLSINTTGQNSFTHMMSLYAPNLPKNARLAIGESFEDEKAVYFNYHKKEKGSFGLKDHDDIMTWTKSNIELNKDTKIRGYITITGTITNTALDTKLNDYALKTDIKELPDDLINETTLTTTLNDYALKEDIPEVPDMTEYRKKTDLEYVNEKQLTVIDKSAVVEPYKSGYVYTIRTEKGEFECKNAELSDNWAFIRPNKMIDWIDVVEKIIMIYWHKQSFLPNQIFMARSEDYSEHNIRNIAEVYCRQDDEIASKSQIPTILDDLINETTLTTTLNDYALKEDIPEVDFTPYIS